ncbi:unnamed protein product [Parnassius apollo]|uniref:(apollo) hypothetical protein n=1 Tax=Parnassius apollo TaxID=110799 RepID=A0A8S3XCE8_PARAO|nr:unnamed protein product [Parnassius apollo]
MNNCINSNSGLDRCLEATALEVSELLTGYSASWSRETIRTLLPLQSFRYMLPSCVQHLCIPLCCCDVENTAWLEFEAPSCNKDEGPGCKGAGVGCDKGESTGCSTVCGCDSGEYLE